MMRVVVKEPKQSSVVKQIDPGFKSLQKVIGGYFETALRGHRFFGDDDLIVYVDEEGLLKNLPLNFFRLTDNAPIVGVAVAMKVNREGDDVSMTEAEAEKVQRYLDKMAA